MGARLNTGADDDLAENSDINVTPFIDVMLVLLIIFMVAAPLATVDMPVDLPAAKAKPQETPKDPLFLNVRSDKTLMIGDEPVTRETLAAVLDRISNSDKETRVFVRAEKAVPYGELTGAMNALRTAGYTKIALVGLSAGAETAAIGQPAPAAPNP